MKKLYVLTIFLIILLVTTSAFGHGVSTGPLGRPVRIQDETFSSGYISMDDFVTVKGVLVNLSGNDYKVSPSIFVDSNLIGEDPFLYELNKFLYDYYPLYGDQSNWHFRMETDLPKIITLKPTEEIKYELKLGNTQRFGAVFTSNLAST
ncbi:MAG: hypothetical protein QW769_09905 [Nitrososphaerales archaeon]